MSDATSVTQRPSWDDLSRSGKGVMVVKVKAGDRRWYYIAPGANRRIPLDRLKSTERRFASLESLVEFTKTKPADVMLIEATPGDVVRKDDDPELEALSPVERKSLFGETSVD